MRCWESPSTSEELVPDVLLIVAAAIALLVIVALVLRNMLRVQADRTVRDVEDLDRR
jgi:hypothetical protein